MESTKHWGEIYFSEVNIFFKNGNDPEGGFKEKMAVDTVYNVDVSAGSVQTSYCAHTVGRTTKVMSQWVSFQVIAKHYSSHR